jgi:hypothetical protein
MRRAFLALAIIAGIAWGGLVGKAASGPEAWEQTRLRTWCFVVMVGAGTAASLRRR